MLSGTPRCTGMYARLKVLTANSSRPNAPAMVPRDAAATNTNPRSNVVATNVIPNNSLVFASACSVVTSNNPWAVKSAVRTRILKVVASGTRAFPKAISRAVDETAARDAAMGRTFPVRLAG